MHGPRKKTQCLYHQNLLPCVLQDTALSLSLSPSLTLSVDWSVQDLDDVAISNATIVPVSRLPV